MSAPPPKSKAKCQPSNGGGREGAAEEDPIVEISDSDLHTLAAAAAAATTTRATVSNCPQPVSVSAEFRALRNNASLNSEQLIYCCFGRIGYVTLRSSSHTRALSADIINYAASLPPRHNLDKRGRPPAVTVAFHKATETISGLVEQTDLLKLHKTGFFPAELHRKITDTAIAATHACTRIPESGLKVTAMKLLLTQPGRGEQPTHCDHPKGFRTIGRYSYFLYLTPDAPFTATWNYTRGNLPCKGLFPLTDVENYSRLWSKSHYLRLTNATVGTATLLHQCMPHFGVENTTGKVCGVIFVQLSEVAVKSSTMKLRKQLDIKSDKYQFYEWHYARLAWTCDSVQYCEALIQGNRDGSDPLQFRFTEKDALEAVRILRKYTGMFAAYFGSEEEPAWVTNARARVNSRKRKFVSHKA